MRNFHIPFDMHTEDKIIGGYLSLRQLAWLLAGAIVPFFLFSMNKGYINKNGDIRPISLAIRILFSLCFIGFGVYLAFFKIDEMEADKYLIKKFIWSRKERIIKYTDKK